MSKNIIITLIFIFLFFKNYKSESIDDSLIKTLYLNKDKLFIENSDIINQNNKKYKNFKFYKIDFSEIENFIENKKYSFIRIHIRLKNEKIFSPLQIYINKTINNFMKRTDENELFMFDYNLNEKNPTIFLPKKYYESTKYFYFFIQTEINIEFIYTIELREDENILIKGDNRFNILFRPGKISIYYELPKPIIEKGFLSIGLLISGILEEQNKLSVNAFCNKNDKIIGNNYPYFINGVGTLINSEELTKCNNDAILIEINNNLNKQIYSEFTTQYVYKCGEDYEINNKLYVNDIFTSIALPENIYSKNKQCIKIVPIVKENDTYNFYLIIRTISSNLYINIYNRNYVKGSSLTRFSHILNIKLKNNLDLNICFSNRNNYNAGIQLQLIKKYDDLNINNYYLFTRNPILPLINGFGSEGSLYGLNKIIFKVDLKTFYSSFGPNKYKDKIIKSHLIISGLSKMKMYHLRCKIFKNYDFDLPDKDKNKECEIIDNISYEINNNIYLNYNYKIENILYYEEFILIKCNNQEDKICNFRIDINVQDNYDTFPTQLFSKISSNLINQDINYYYNTIVKSNIETYKITISNKLKQGTKIYFILYMFSGDADMAIYDYNDDNEIERVVQDAFYSTIEKKKLLIYEIKKINKNICFRELLLKITGLCSGYYSVKYYIISEDNNREKLSSLPIQEYNLEKIIFNNSEKIYSLELPKNKNISEFNEIFDEYYITINSINCILEASFMNKKYIGREMQILYNLKNIDNKLKIRLNKLDSNNNNIDSEFCTYYISSNPIGYKENNIIISGGIIYSMTLTKKINSIAYIYPYVYNGNIINIDLYKYNKDELKISVLINNDAIIYDSILKNINYKKIVIFLATLEKYCKNINTNNYYKITYIEENYVNNFNFCPIHIKIELPYESKYYDDNYKNYYQLEIFSASQTPTYLKSNEIVFNSILVNQYRLYAKKSDYIYYYSDIGNEFPYEIILNFKYGYGEAVAKIMDREDIDILPTWNRKVRLPTNVDIDKTNYLEYDYETNRFIIDEKYRKKCEEGCEIFIGIFSRETSSYFQINDFYLILNKNNNKPINLYFDMEINDFLNKEIREKYYLSKLENNNIDSLFFSFNSNYCKLCIILISNENISDESIDINNYKNKKCDWEFSKENELSYKKEYIFNINMNDPKLKRNKLTKTKLLSKIYSNFENYNNLYYSLKINKKQKNLPLIVKIGSTNNDMTILDNENGLGYYTIHIQDYQLIRELHIFVLSEELIINNNIILYSKIFSMEEYNEKGVNKNMIENIINSNMEKEKSKNYLHLNLGEENCDKIVLVIVKCFCMDKLPKLSNHYVKILTSFYKSSINTSLRSYNYRIYEVGIKPINFFIPLINNKYSIVIINCIKGKGKITLNHKYNINIEDSKNNYKIILHKNKGENFFDIGVFDNSKSLNSEGFLVFYIYLLYENIFNYAYKITPQKNNFIYYSSNQSIRNNKNFNFYYDLSYLFEYNRKKYNSNLLILEIAFLNTSFNKNNYKIIEVKCSLTKTEEILNEDNKLEDYYVGDIYYSNISGSIFTIFDINYNNLKENKNRYIYISIKNNFINFDNNDNYFSVNIKEKSSDNINEIINNYIEIAKYSNYNYIKNENKKNTSDIQDKDNIKENKPKKEIKNKFAFSKKYLIIIIIILIIVFILYILRNYKKCNSKTINENYKKMNYELPIINN